MSSVRHHLYAIALILSIIPSYLAAAHALTAHEPLLFSSAPLHLANGSTGIEISGTQTKGHWAFDGRENRVPFLEQHGTINLATQDIFAGLPTPAAGSLAKKYGVDVGTKVQGKNAVLRFNAPDNNYATTTMQLSATQQLFSGLFMRATAHFSTYEIKQSISAEGADAADPKIVAFLADFDALLAEYKLSPVTSFRRESTVDRGAFFMGWEGCYQSNQGAVTELAGSIAAGYQFTPALFTNPLASALLPATISDGFSMQMAMHARLLSYLSLNASCATTVFTQRYGTYPIVTDTGTTPYVGPLLLGSGFIKKNPGTLWQLMLGAALDSEKGWYLRADYSFAYQESTELSLGHTAGTSTASTILAAMAATPAAQYNRLNADPKLQNWKNHAVTFSLGFRPKPAARRFLPAFNGAFTIPLGGRRSVCPSQQLHGSLGLTAQWTF